nr:MBL fold metallo-hydrolase [Candidatus Sigynarchaeota archaeon]
MQLHKKFYQVSPNLKIHAGAVNSSIITMHEKAVMIDCDDTVDPELLHAAGLPIPSSILCTQHRRTHTAGIPAFLILGTKIVGPKSERNLFEKNGTYWKDPINRWHIYHHQPGPLVPTTRIPLSGKVRGGDEIKCEDIVFTVVDTPGITSGSVSYSCEVDGYKMVFCGDLIYGDGQMVDLYSMQAAYREVGDYHGFIGSKDLLVASVERIVALHPDILIPSHGPVLHGFDSIQQAISALKTRFSSLWLNYVSISALNFYFPRMFSDLRTDPQRMVPAIQIELPSFLQRVTGTSFILLSDDGIAFLIDCGSRDVVKRLKQWQDQGKIKAVEACWITHYHDDHVDGLIDLIEQFKCPVIVDQHLTEILEHPDRFFLPCISPVHVVVSKSTKERERWQWHEFALTAMHLPGQTYYHGGLLVEGHDHKIFIAGDSASPSGIDDYCAPNRTFLRENTGYFKCISLWREFMPDIIVNNHQEKGFTFTLDHLAYMEGQLHERVRILKKLIPWPDPTFGLDESWIRVYPFEQTIKAGERALLEIHFTNHDTQHVQARVEPVLPEGWSLDLEPNSLSASVPPCTEGMTGSFLENPDVAIPVACRSPSRSRKQPVVIAIRAWWGERYLGPVRHAIVHLR